MSTDRIEKEVLLKAPLERVWRAISDADEFGRAFGVLACSGRNRGHGLNLSRGSGRWDIPAGPGYRATVPGDTVSACRPHQARVRCRLGYSRHASISRTSQALFHGMRSASVRQ